MLFDMAYRTLVFSKNEKNVPAYFSFISAARTDVCCDFLLYSVTNRLMSPLQYTQISFFEEMDLPH